MGSCLCKTTRRASQLHHNNHSHHNNNSNNHHNHHQHYQGSLASMDIEGSSRCSSSDLAQIIMMKKSEATSSLANNRIWSMQTKLSMHADRLVIDTLESIRPTVLNEPSNSMQKLHLIAEQEIGWLVVISSLINKVDLEHPFGSALILLILEDAPLPSRKSICQLDEVLCLQMSRERSVAKQRNISIVLGCLAEKLAGSLSQALFSTSVQDYLLSRIEPCNDPNVILYSLIALEKFSQTIDNKMMIVDRLKRLGAKNPLLKLEHLTVNSATSNVTTVAANDCNNNNISITNNKQQTPRDFLEQQVSFCAKWHLDNYFLVEGRPYTYETIDRTDLNALLNSKDVSENLKISPDGLAARNDTSRFESVRCTYPITSGIYYYEVHLVTAGVMQIGLATKQSKFLNHDGFGIGDDEHSVAYDGCRQLLWQGAKSIHTGLARWKEGDVVGCLINLDQFEVRFSLNGQLGEPNSGIFKNKSLSTQYYAAASFMPFQQCTFNFGRVPFKYPPIDYDFKAFNQCASLSEGERTVLPRHLLLRKVHSSNLMINTCTICCDNIARVTLQPCNHNGFCEVCANLLEICPLCRTGITCRKMI